MEKGLIHIYCGDGKGKTTACLGLALRWSGRDKKVLFVQFLKSHQTGEINSLQSLPNITLMRGKETKKFTFQMNDEEKKEVLEAHKLLFDNVKNIINENQIDLLVLDEIIGACNNLVFSEQDLVDFLNTKPKSLEVVLSGRNPSQVLLKIADYVSVLESLD